MKRVMAALAVVAWLGPGGTGAHAAPQVEMLLGGGTILDWSNPSDIGNGFGAGVLLYWQDLGIGLAGAAVLPDSATPGQFGAFWVEGRWHPWGRPAVFSPFAVAGIGLATEDEFEAGKDAPESVRWVSGSPSFLAMIGFGVRYGAPEGLYLTLDLRTYNHTHGGVNLVAGYAF